MVAINFTVFVDKVESGEKRRTIRRKRRCEPGAKLQLYTGMMHKGCRKLRDATCISVTKVELRHDSVEIFDDFPHIIEGEWADQFARDDGFDDFEHMIGWFRKTYPKDEFPIILYDHFWDPKPKGEEAPVQKRHPRPRRYPKKRKA